MIFSLCQSGTSFCLRPLVCSRELLSGQHRAGARCCSSIVLGGRSPCTMMRVGQTIWSKLPEILSEPNFSPCLFLEILWQYRKELSSFWRNPDFKSIIHHIMCRKDRAPAAIHTSSGKMKVFSILNYIHSHGGAEVMGWLSHYSGCWPDDRKR